MTDTANNAVNGITTSNTVHTAEDLNKVSTGDLPWSQVMMPPDSGANKHTLQPEDMVYGVFLDDDMQQPLILGVFKGGSGAGMAGSSGSVNGQGTGTGSGDIIPSTSGGANSEQAYFLLIKYGYTPQNAAGIVGNLLAESMNKGDIDPNIKEKENNQSYSARGFGIAQWTTQSRKDGLMAHAGNKYNTIEGQVSFLVRELKTTEGYAEKCLRNASNDLEGSVMAFLEFERPAGHSMALRKATGLGFRRDHEKVRTRYGYAKSFYDRMANKSPDSSGTTTPSTTPTSTGTTSVA